MECDYPNNHHFKSGELLKALKTFGRRTALVFTRGDRKVRATFRDMTWGTITDTDGTNIVLEEDIEDIDEANRMEIPVSQIEGADYYQEELDDDGYYIVIKLKTGNELHIHSLVA